MIEIHDDYDCDHLCEECSWKTCSSRTIDFETQINNLINKIEKNWVPSKTYIINMIKDSLSF